MKNRHPKSAVFSPQSRITLQRLTEVLLKMFYIVKQSTMSIKNTDSAACLYTRKIFTEKLIQTGFDRNIDTQAEKFLLGYK